MTNPDQARGVSRCPRCGYDFQPQDKFCAQCGAFLRDPWVDHRLLLALTLERDGHSAEARQELERLLLSEPEHVLANHLLGNLCFHEGVLLEAIRHYERALAGSPHFARGYYDLGVAWYHHGDMPEAIDAFEHCLQIDPHYNAAHYRLAVCYFHAGRLEEALQQFES
ncbi:MAG TPA: tetratricopeptide repeat protein, partial [Terriglobales bacterium]